MLTTPYTYLIGWSKLNKWYYGSRTKRGCHPSMFWVNYHTSSKYVAWMREFYGEPDVIQIRKIFDNKEDAMKWERNVLKKMDVINNDSFLNKSDGFGTPSGGMLGHKHTEKTKLIMSMQQSGTKNGFFGYKHTKESKLKISIGCTGKTLSENQKKAISKRRNGVSNRGSGFVLSTETKTKIKNTMLGIKHTEQRKKNISLAHKGKSWFNNGKQQTLCFNPPEGYIKGRLKRGNC
jgi:hypothetical protein